MLVTMDWCSCVILWLLLSVFKIYSSGIKVENVNLRWTEANEECNLMTFLQFRSEYKKFLNQMTLNKKYWIKDSKKEISVEIKGCQTNVKFRNSTTFSNNLLLNCFKFCGNTNEIGIKGNNCSCLSTSQSYQSNSQCDVQCLWDNTPCKDSLAFTVFQQNADNPSLAGHQLEECILIEKISDHVKLVKDNCTKEFNSVCKAKSGNLPMTSGKATWLQALLKCYEKNSTLAYNLSLQGSLHGFYWLGIRQYFYSENVNPSDSDCPCVSRHNENDVNFPNCPCKTEQGHICLNEKRETEHVTDSSQCQESTKAKIFHVYNSGEDPGSSKIPGIVVAVLATIVIVLVVIVCLFKRRRKAGSAYQSPVVVYNTEQLYNLSHDGSVKSGKSAPIKPTRRSKKSQPESLVAGTAYENIVLTFEDPSTISRVVSSGSTVQSQAKKKEDDNYDVMGTSNRSDNASQNVYGFSSPEGEYDVMNRDNRRNDEQNNLYDHM